MTASYYSYHNHVTWARFTITPQRVYQAGTQRGKRHRKYHVRQYPQMTPHTAYVNATDGMWSWQLPSSARAMTVRHAEHVNAPTPEAPRCQWRCARPMIGMERVTAQMHGSIPLCKAHEQCAAHGITERAKNMVIGYRVEHPPGAPGGVVQTATLPPSGSRTDPPLSHSFCTNATGR